MVRKVSWFEWLRCVGAFVVLLTIVIGSKPVLAHVADPDGEALIEGEALGGEAEDIDKLKKEIQELQNKIDELQKEKNSLSSAIKFLDSKILLTEKEIQKSTQEIALLERQITELSERIQGLEANLDELSAELIHRIREQYKRSTTDSVSIIFAATGLNNFFKEHKYIEQVRAHTQELLLSTEEKRQQYDEEKVHKQQKQDEIETLRKKLLSQQEDLERQKNDKKRLLIETHNNEQTYQQKLAKALAEYNAVTTICSGGGAESQVRQVKTGETIASIIPGASTCSSGTHLHFQVRKNESCINPAGYLKSESIVWYDDAFGFSGNWEWPIHNPAIITQGFGMTKYAKGASSGGRCLYGRNTTTGSCNPHTGIDMVSKTPGNLGVRATSDGTLYRGSVPCGSGYLRYVRVKHSDELSSYYLHVNY